MGICFFQKQWKLPSLSTAIKNILVGFIFAILFQISINFASLPGEITAIWLPSALTLAAAIRDGRSVAPGIFLGAFVSTGRVLLGLMPVLTLTQAIALDLTFAACETVQPFLAVQWMRKVTPRSVDGCTVRFDTIRSVTGFMIAAILAPVVPALVGAIAWSTTDGFSGNVFWLTWITWWLPATMAHLIFTPPLLLGRRALTHLPRAKRHEALLIAAVGMGLMGLVFGLGYPVEYILLPILILAVFRLGLIYASLGLATITVVAIFSTNQGWGPFVRNSPHESFIFLQSFLAVLSLTILLLSAVLSERQASRLSLQQTLASLEQKVADRSAQLYKSEMILSGFFSSAPVGMGILDKQLNFIRVNSVLSDLNQRSGEKTAEEGPCGLAPELSSAMRAAHGQVLTTQQPLLNQEIESLEPARSGLKRAWLISYFPIQDVDGAVSQVGLVLLEISKFKQLEAHLKQQVHIDALTQIANRRCFNQQLQYQWNRCAHAQQPLSLILCDVDDFKAYNDRYGHPQGDECLVQVAQVIRRSAHRKDDLAVRYGGEEFALMLPNTAATAALNIAIALQQDLRDLRIHHATSSVGHYVTLSMGIASHMPQPGDQAETLIAIADRALYKAKRSGKNRIVVGQWGA